MLIRKLSGKTDVMCIARVGKVAAESQGRALVEFFDGRSLDGVDVSVAGAKRGDFVEVFGDLALSVITPREAERRRAAWREVREAAMLVPPRHGRSRRTGRDSPSEGFSV